MSQIREGAGGSARVCYYCALVELPSHLDPARKTELRPYGPGGAPVCFPCATRPDREAQTEQQFEDQVDAAGGAVVLTKDGPKPIDDASIADGYAIAVVPPKPRDN